MAAAPAKGPPGRDRGPLAEPNRAIKYDCTIFIPISPCIFVGVCHFPTALPPKIRRPFLGISPAFPGISRTFPTSAGLAAAPHAAVAPRSWTGTYGTTAGAIGFFTQKHIFITAHNNQPKQIAIFVSFYSIFAISAFCSRRTPPTLCRICPAVPWGASGGRAGTFFPL